MNEFPKIGFDFPPLQSAEHSVGLLMIHGLYDTPYIFREFAERLSQAGIHCRAILLSGHGTTPEDLLSVHYEDWVRDAEQGLQNFQNETKQKAFYVLGHSTGALLCLHLLKKHPEIKGCILVAPAFRLHALPEWIGNVYQRFDPLFSCIKWVTRAPEINAVKYRSLTINSVLQLIHLRDSFLSEIKKENLPPILMLLTEEDETIDSSAAYDWFCSLPSPVHRLLMYSHAPRNDRDARIERKNSYFPALQIQHLSHCCFFTSSRNAYYGLNGAYSLASRLTTEKVRYGAYHRLWSTWSSWKQNMFLSEYRDMELTYNPDVESVVERVVRFVMGGVY